MSAITLKIFIIWRKKIWASIKFSLKCKGSSLKEGNCSLRFTTCLFIHFNCIAELKSVGQCRHAHNTDKLKVIISKKNSDKNPNISFKTYPLKE